MRLRDRALMITVEGLYHVATGIVMVANGVVSIANALNGLIDGTGWDIIEAHDGSKHVVPTRDLVGHECSEDCVCGPKVTLIEDVEPDVWLISHNALDGRE